MDRKYTIIFILIWLIVSIIIALFLFLPFIFFAIAVLLILLAYDFYQKGRSGEDTSVPKYTVPRPVVPPSPAPDMRAVQAKENKVPSVPEGINQAAADLKNKGNAFFRQNKFEDAIRCYASAVDIDPGYIDAWNNLGLAFLKTGKVDLAKSCNEKVKELRSTRPPEPEQEPVSRSPVIAEIPVPLEQAISPPEKTEPPGEAGQETEADTISFLRNVARPAGYNKEEPDNKSDSGGVPGITREFTDIPTITADKEPDWKNLFKRVSEMDAHGVNIPSGATEKMNAKSGRAESPAFDRVIPPSDNGTVPDIHPAGEMINEPVTIPPVIKAESELPVPKKEDVMPGPAPVEITVTQEEPEITVPKKEDVMPGPVPVEITVTQEEPEITVPKKEDVMPGPAPEEITITQEEPEITVPKKEDVMPGPAPEEITIIQDEIPVHVTVQVTAEPISEADKEEVPFPYDMDAEIPGYTLLPPELEEFPEDITDIISPGPDNFPVIPGEATARPVEEEITKDIKGDIPAPGGKGKTPPEEIEVPRRELSGPDQEEKTTGPVRKGEGPSVVRSETAIRKPKAERFPQEITGGFEPYEQMIAHESLLVSERAARDEVQIPGRTAEKQILIVDDNDYIVTGLEHMLKKNGYLTASCNSGQEALEILGKKNIDAVLLDLNMEPMSGWQLLGIMRSDVQTKDIPVIIFSAKETLQEEASRTPLKISAFLSKPVNTRLLLSELKKIFEEGDIRKLE